MGVTSERQQSPAAMSFSMRKMRLLIALACLVAQTWVPAPARGDTPQPECPGGTAAHCVCWRESGMLHMTCARPAGNAGPSAAP